MRRLMRRLILLLLFVAATAHADTTDPFGAIPNRETEAPKGDGTAGTTAEPGPDGSLSYAFPIDLPPGRNGMTPRVSLKYSSRRQPPAETSIAVASFIRALDGLGSVEPSRTSRTDQRCPS